MHVHLVLLLNAERFQVFHHQPDQFTLQGKRNIICNTCIMCTPWDGILVVLPLLWLVSLRNRNQLCLKGKHCASRVEGIEKMDCLANSDVHVENKEAAWDGGQHDVVVKIILEKWCQETSKAVSKHLDSIPLPSWGTLPHSHAPHGPCGLFDVHYLNNLESTEQLGYDHCEYCHLGHHTREGLGQWGAPGQQGAQHRHPLKVKLTVKENLICFPTMITTRPHLAQAMVWAILREVCGRSLQL